MKQQGWFLIKVRKCITILLFSEIKAELEEMMGMAKGSQVVPCFYDGTNEYIELNGKMIRI